MQIGDYALRPIQEEDLRQLLEWRNSPRIHSLMLTDHIITWEEHKAWYDRIKDEKPPCHLAFTYQGNLAGYVGFNDYDPQQKEAFPGNYLGDKKSVPVDAGLCQMYLLSEYAYNVLHLERLVNIALLRNKRVVKLYQMDNEEALEYIEIKKGNQVEKAVRKITSKQGWEIQKNDMKQMIGNI